MDPKTPARTKALSCLGLFAALVPLSTASAQTTEPSLILGKPTASSITINAMANRGQLSFEYGTAQGSYTSTTSPIQLSTDPVEVELTNLQANTRYFYRALYQAEGETEATPSAEHTFHTHRPAGNSFTFTIQADSHQGYEPFYNADLYAVALNNVRQDNPDFHIDLGDTFSLDDADETQSSIFQKYVNQRDFFSTVGHSSPIFLVLGNHENEEGWNLDDRDSLADAVPVLGANARKRFFANPVPSGGAYPFYTGNLDDSIQEISEDHLKEDYYAFEWGDALFVAIDPFWYTMVKPYAGTIGGEANDETVGNRWDWTLGEAQYEWLRQTLENSDAAYKFVFAHHLVGGNQDYSRAGAQGAKYCEWGGYDIDGETWGFDVHRPNLVMPIHDLMVANGVGIFFHGHDHVFVTEMLDGIIYQECPHVANADYGKGFPTNEVNYSPFELINNSGHLRVTVSSSEAQVEYVRAFLDGDGTNGEIGYDYELDPLPQNQKPIAQADSANTTEQSAVAIDVLGNDSDADGDSLSVAGVSQPSHGTAVNRGTDVYYQPQVGYCDEDAPDSFRYAVKDGRGGSRTTTVEVTVKCGIVNAPPTAVDDVATIIMSRPGLINAIKNDTDPEGQLDPKTAHVIDEPSSGRVVNNGNGSFIYTPNYGFLGTDSFEYEVCDVGNACDSAQVQLNVVPCATGEDCSDGNPCTNDSCTDGVCSNPPLDCDDGDACTTDSCNAGACVNTALDCSDSFSCTADTCVNGACLHTPQNSVCVGSDLCSTYTCDPEQANADADGCVTAPMDCNDNNACTDDSCSIATGCVNQPITCGTDNNACTSDACDPAMGCNYPPVSCDDNVACTVDSCDSAGGCLHVPSQQLCDDGDACTVDVCGPTGCTHTALNCDDNNLCTTDSCAGGFCVNALLDCGEDMCHVSSCNPDTGECGGPPLDCDDADPCTTDSCDEVLGCVHEPVVCSGGSACSPVSCNPATGACDIAPPLDCDDHNPCTEDTCNDSLGCVHTNLTSSCDDNNSCTLNDQCNQGMCVGFAMDCTALDTECSVGQCDGLENPSCIATPLKEGRKCTGGTCHNGACVADGKHRDGGEPTQDAGTTPEPSDSGDTGGTSEPDAGHTTIGSLDAGRPLTDGKTPVSNAGDASGKDGGVTTTTVFNKPGDAGDTDVNSDSGATSCDCTIGRLRGLHHSQTLWLWVAVGIWCGRRRQRRTAKCRVL